jgi:hypothetical protein
MPGSPTVLLRLVTCPHCWKTFHPEDVLWISVHADLIGDALLGAEHQQRLLPTRFNLAGNALDARGFECQSLACPHCHLVVPRALLEAEPLFVSILGAPGCGKSYYLAALTWELRKVLPGKFRLGFTDVDPLLNQDLTAKEEALFLNPRASGYQNLASLIGKTKLQGEMYDTVSYGNQLVSYPRPYLFSLRPLEQHHQYNQGQRAGRVLCLYDNAGEHFQPGQETTAAPVTQHLARAQVLLYLFDPTQDLRFQRQLGGGAGAVQGSRQDVILLEAAARIRRHLGLPEGAKHDRPLVVVLTKSDAWLHLLGAKNPVEPWHEAAGACLLYTERIERRSNEVRALLAGACPELIQAAETFTSDVLYVPVSALGHPPRQAPEGPAARPADIKPIWATVPILYGMYRWMNHLVPGLRRGASAAPPRRPEPNALPG